MTLPVETGYKLFCEQQESEGGQWIDSVCYCLFDGYDEGIGGYEHREELRMKRPSIYEDLAKVTCLDDFAAVIARLKLERES